MTVLSGGTPADTPLRLVPWRERDENRPLDYHMHTTYTDGQASALEMAQAAKDAGLHEILFSEHIRHTSTYYPTFAQEIRELPVAGCRLGLEAKILDLQGTLDCPPAAASLCDAIVGSVHSPPEGRWSDHSPETALALELELALSIVQKSRAHILGHPLGIVITRFGLKPVDELFLLACACREAGVAFELNARYCTDVSTWLDLVERAGCQVSLGSDAHQVEAVGSAWSMFVKKGQQD